MGEEREPGSIVMIQPSVREKVSWFLSPSKSHMIRWLLLASISNGETEIAFTGSPGDDIHSMASCIEKMGIRIEKNKNSWIVYGKGTNGLTHTNETLDCGNSGTTMRFLIPQVACFSSPMTLDGDWTLRNRHLSSSTDSIRRLGANISTNNEKMGAPYSICGPLKPGKTQLDTSLSSQSLSALVLVSPRISGPIEIQTKGESVSNRHAALTFEIAQLTGCATSWSDDSKSFIIHPWTPKCPDKVTIPSDLSLAAFGIVAATAHAATLEILNPTKPTDGIGAEIIYNIIQKQDTSPMDLDLRDCNDLLPALSAYLAMGPGGRIRNAAHARFKESDRISKTVEMLECFGINVKAFEDGIETEGKQIPTRPTEIVNVYGDHRLFMTAACIASKTGGEITDNGVWSITDPSFPIQIGF
ncbi:MAG TPA: hypothetical protein QF555_01250 [Candidatus Thalassarchaeaceae archaeon]|nr:hypothetical protein [Candidatus Thalassarchaeaceae archaeon]